VPHPDILQAVSIVSVYHTFLDSVQRHAQRPALHIAGYEYTYADFNARVQRIRALLRTQNLGEAPLRVGVFTGEHVDVYAAIVAVLGSGAAYVPVNHKFPPERNLGIVQDAGLAVLLAAQPSAELGALRSMLPPHVKIHYTQGLKDNPTAPAATPAPMPEAADMAYLLFTSGSTGRPKGVPIAHGNLNAFLNAVLSPALYALSEQDRFLQMFELTFDLSVYSFLAPLCVGACCCVVPAEGVSYLNILQTLDEQRVTVALMVPSALAYLRAYFDEIALPHLRYSLFCGEALPATLAKAWQARVPHARIENVYGPTEATIFCSRYVWQAQSEAESFYGIVPIGQPLPGVSMVLLDEHNNPAHEGELCLGGAQITAGYWHNAERNASAFVAVPAQGRHYRTGDLCRRNNQGDYLFLGRADQQVKIDGYRVELGEIEHHARRLTQHTAGQVAVVALPNVQGTHTLHLFLERFTGNTDALQEALATQLPAYMVPHQVHTLPAFPLNTNGKIDRKALAAQIQ
jgi:amino acid adenylation domain-containing protein